MEVRPGFIVALSQLNEAKPSEIIERLFAVFVSIGQMSTHEVVAAYQAITLTAQRVGLSQEDVSSLLRACEDRMFAIYGPMNPYGDRAACKQLAVRRLFSQVIGRDIDKIRNVSEKTGS